MKKHAFLLVCGLVVANPLFATPVPAINDNLQDINQQIKQVNQALQSKQQQQQQINDALKHSQEAITKYNLLLNQLRTKRQANVLQLQNLTKTIPQLESATTQAKQNVNNAITQSYQQLRQVRSQQQSVLSGNDALASERKKIYLISVLNTQQQQYQNLATKLNQLQNLNNNLQAEITRLDQQLGDQNKTHQTLLITQDQKAQQAAAVKKQIVAEKNKLTHLKQQQIRLNRLLHNLLAQERKQQVQTKSSVTKNSNPAAILAGADTLANETTANSTTSDNNSAANQSNLNQQDFFNKQKLTKPLNGQIIVNYGQVRDNVKSNGLLIAANNTPIYALTNGSVLFSGELAGFGQIIVIDNGNNYTAVYSGILANVTKGNKVSAGQVIANSGSEANQPMGGVYFELRHLGTPINPSSLFQ